MSATIDCRTCGACCSIPEDDVTVVDLRDVDVKRLTARWRERNVRAPDSMHSILSKRDSAGHVVCAALRGTVGKRVSCGIYERRPNICRRFKPGSRACWAARAGHGMEVR